MKHVSLEMFLECCLAILQSRMSITVYVRSVLTAESARLPGYRLPGPYSYIRSATRRQLPPRSSSYNLNLVSFFSGKSSKLLPPDVRFYG